MAISGGTGTARTALFAGLVLVGVAGVVGVYLVGSTDASAPGSEPSDPLAPVRTTPIPFGNPLLEPGVDVVGRYGAPARRPANTAASYEVAARSGADYLETEVVVSKDGALVAYGDNELSAGTDVDTLPQFADRETTKTVDGEQVTGWFSEDFTLAELLTLRVVEPEPALRPTSAAYDGRYGLLTLTEVLVLVDDLSERVGRDLGLVVQVRRAPYFRELGLPVEGRIARVVARSGLDDEPGRVVLESGDGDVVARLDGLVGDDVRLMFVVVAERAALLDDVDGLPAGIDAVAVEVPAFSGRDPDALIDELHDDGLAVAVWPVTAEAAPGAEQFEADVRASADLGVDLFLTETPERVVAALR